MLLAVLALQRNLKIAEALKLEAEQKRAEALRLAKEWQAAKDAAEKAAKARCILFICAKITCNDC
jgi:hypothetical protein